MMLFIDIYKNVINSQKALHFSKVLYIIVEHDFYIMRAGMAQLVEQLIRNQQVVGSSPILSFLEYV